MMMFRRRRLLMRSKDSLLLSIGISNALFHSVAPTHRESPACQAHRLGWLHQPNNTNHVDPFKLNCASMLGLMKPAQPTSSMSARAAPENQRSSEHSASGFPVRAYVRSHRAPPTPHRQLPSTSGVTDPANVTNRDHQSESTPES